MTQDIYHLDFETASVVDIFKLGGHRYADDPSTVILMFAIKKNDGTTVLWDIIDGGNQALALLSEAIESESLIYAHNASFEQAICHFKLSKQLGLRPPKIENWRCTAAMCRRAAIPPALDKACKFLKFEDGKDQKGKALIGLFSDLRKEYLLKPPARPEEDRGKRWTTPKPVSIKSPSPILEEDIPWSRLVTMGGEQITVSEAWEQFKDYCIQDVEAEALLHKKLRHFELTGDILESFQFNLRMNQLGSPVNLKALKHVDSLINEFQARVGGCFEELTELRPTQTVKLLLWLKDHGYHEDNLQADTVERVAKNNDMDADGRRALELLQLLKFAAIAKVPTMINAACADGTIKGSTLWHGARTGRASGRIHQPQNFKRATMETSLAYQMICEGDPLEEFELMWDSPLEVFASCIRHFIQHPTLEFLDGDYTGVEARITPWLAGDQKKLDSIMAGVDQYKATGSMIFNKPIDEITKDERTKSKPVELGCCIAKGQLVLTDRGEVPIEEISIDDLVWDGVGFVQHEGLIYQGIREVITHDGLTATSDHEVWVEGLQRKIPLGEAQRQSLRLRDTGTGGPRFWKTEAPVSENKEGEGTPICGSEMWMWWSKMGFTGQLEVGKNAPVFKVQRSHVSLGEPNMDYVSVPCSNGEMSKPKLASVEELRRAGHTVQFPEPNCSGDLDEGEPRAGEALGNRQNRQRRSLRARESEMGNQVGTDAEQQENDASEGIQFLPKGVALLEVHDGEKTEGREVSGGYSPRSSGGCGFENEELQADSRKVEVYDLYNAGPRHRFTVSGKLVSNCFGVGGRGLQISLRDIHGVALPLKECKRIVSVYRKNHPETVQAWADIESAAKKAIVSGVASTILQGRVTISKRQYSGVKFLVMTLPSGRSLYYPHPRIVEVTKKYTKEEMAEEEWKRKKKIYTMEEIQFYGTSPGTSRWGFVGTYGSRLFENLVQSIGADLLEAGCVQAEKEGYEIFAVIHDQALALAKEGKSFEGFAKALCYKKPWAETFPLEADGGIAPYYRKD